MKPISKVDAADQIRPCWFIDLGWYRQNNRSFLVKAQGCLCPKCYQRLKESEVSVEELLAAIKDCCSDTPDFINNKLPILEGIFRLFLTNGNQPLDVEGIGEQLREWRGGDTYRTSNEVLTRLLEHDQYYGLRQAQG